MASEESNQAASTGDEYLKTPEAAEMLLISVETLRQLRVAGAIRYYQPSKGKVMFLRSDVEKYRQKSFKNE